MHTPGPWHTSPRQDGPSGQGRVEILSSDSGWIAEVLHGSHQDANARLIASAPKLLEALERMLAEKERHHQAIPAGAAIIACAGCLGPDKMAYAALREVKGE